MMKNYRTLLIGAFVAIVLTACGSRLTQHNFDKIKEDMSQKQVEAILGKPTTSDTSSVPLIGTEVTTYTYRDKKSEVNIVFKDNKVITKTGHFSE